MYVGGMNAQNNYNIKEGRERDLYGDRFLHSTEVVTLSL